MRQTQSPALVTLTDGVVAICAAEVRAGLDVVRRAPKRNTGLPRNTPRRTVTMLRFASPVTLNLSRGELLSWQQGRVQLRVVSGTAWVTRPNDLDDHFLKPGQTLDLCEGLIGAESDLCLRIEAAASGQPAQSSAWPKKNRSTPVVNVVAPRPSGWASARTAMPGTR
jgi:Protein of unknown function (DUF2917)